MEEGGFSWGTLGAGTISNNMLNSRLDEIEVLIERNYLEILNARDTKLELLKLLHELKGMIGSIPAMLEASVLKYRREDFDENSVTSFVTLDELGIDIQERPDEDVKVEEIEVKVVESGLTAPPPVKVDEYTLDGLEDEEVVDVVLEKLESYLLENGPIMNSHLKLRGILPQGYSLSKKAKKLMKERVNSDDSDITLHKLDRIRGFYYKSSSWDSDISPDEIYDQTLRNKE